MKYRRAKQIGLSYLFCFSYVFMSALSLFKLEIQQIEKEEGLVVFKPVL